MTGLPNLQKLIEQATPGKWIVVVEEDREAWVTSESSGHVTPRPEPWSGAGCSDTDARLIAAAPALAELLIECEQALKAIKERTEDYPVRPTYACLDATELAAAALARLADYDKEIG